MDKFGEPTCYQLNGIRLNVTIQGEGPALILLHGWTNNWRIWQPLANELATNFRLVMVDMPGFGQSDRLSEYSMEGTVAMLRQLVERLELYRPALAGLSLGSFVAAYLAEHHQDMFGELILVGPILEGRKKACIKWVLHLCRRQYWLGAMLTRTIKSPWSGYIMERFVNSRHYDPQLTGRFRSLGRREFSSKAYLDFGWESFRVDIEQALLASSQRVLLVYGQNDKHAKPARLAMLAAQREGIELAEIPGAAHNSPFEAPVATAEAFYSFLTPVGKPLGEYEPTGDDFVQASAFIETGQGVVDIFE